MVMINIPTIAVAQEPAGAGAPLTFAIRPRPPTACADTTEPRRTVVRCSERSPVSS